MNSCLHIYKYYNKIKISRCKLLVHNFQNNYHSSGWSCKPLTQTIQLPYVFPWIFVSEIWSFFPACLIHFYVFKNIKPVTHRFSTHSNFTFLVLSNLVITRINAFMFIAERLLLTLIVHFRQIQIVTNKINTSFIVPVVVYVSEWMFEMMASAS